MYEIEFYEDKNGKSEIADYIKELNQKASTNKESRINFNKIIAYIDLLDYKTIFRKERLICLHGKN